MLPFFEITITFDDVINHKPDPEPYLNAANFFGLDPKECIAVEDSVSGSQSAMTAGCYTIGVLNSIPADQLKVDRIFETSGEVMEWLVHMK